MKIKLDDSHYLNGDKYCYWLTCEYKTKTGKVAERRISGYCGDFYKAVDTYIENKIKSVETDKISDIRDTVEALKREIRSWKVALTENDKI